MVSSDNHFITVSRAGSLVARRKGQRPVEVATREGLVVASDAEARARGAPETIRVRFTHGGGNRAVCVTAVEVDGERLTADAFQQRFDVDDVRLGRWIRSAVELALDLDAR